MKFLHTSDWQMGMKATAAGSHAGRVRQERLAAAQRVIGLAQRENVSFILLAGDTFEDNAVDRVLVRQTAEILQSFPGPVFLLPGNHDPLVPGSVWEHPVWTEFANLTVCREAQALELDACILHPCPLTSKYSSQDPTKWIRRSPGEKIALGLAHGTVEGVPAAEPDYPIPRDAAAQRDLDYLAIGHWHSYSAYPDAAGAIRMAYPGTHETTKFGERDSGNVLLVEIDGPRAVPRLHSARTGGLHWPTIERTLAHPGDLPALLAEVRNLPDPGQTLLRIRLDGVLHADDRSALTQLQEVLDARFLHGSLDSAAIPQPGDDSWIAGLPLGPCRNAAIALRDRAAHTPDPASKAVHAQALMILFELHEKAEP